MISDSKLVQIAFIDVASYLPPPLVSFCKKRKDHAVAAFAPFLLILLKSEPHT